VDTGGDTDFFETTMNIIAIDPGTYLNGVIGLHDIDGVIRIGVSCDMSHEELIKTVSMGLSDFVVCEWMECHGNAVGQETFETVFNIGRFCQASKSHFRRVTRRMAKMHLTHNAKANDSNIRAAIIDRFGGELAIGKKKNPGPLYGVSGHQWQALAVGLTFLDQQRGEQS
jgi:hypothetical protein